MIHLRFVSFVLCTAAAGAQSLTVSAATPLVVSAHDAATTSTQTLPAGPLPAFGQITASIPMVQSYTQWQADVTPRALTFALVQMAVVAPQATASASASAGQHDFLLHVSAPSPTLVTVSGNRWFEATPGSPFPLVQVDVLDDGVPEFVVTSTSTGPSWPLAVLTIGPQPVPIRVRAENLAPAAGNGAIAQLRIAVTPNNLLTIDPIVPGCATAFLDCSPSFTGTGVDFWAGSVSFHPSVLVLGLGLQPALLPVFNGLPCVLAPTPDLLVFATSANALPFTLPLPAAVRPVIVYAQLAMLQGAQITLTDGFRIDAY